MVASPRPRGSVVRRVMSADTGTAMAASTSAVRPPTARARPRGRGRSLTGSCLGAGDERYGGDALFGIGIELAGDHRGWVACALLLEARLLDVGLDVHPVHARGHGRSPVVLLRVLVDPIGRRPDVLGSHHAARDAAAGGAEHPDVTAWLVHRPAFEAVVRVDGTLGLADERLAVQVGVGARSERDALRGMSFVGPGLPVRSQL